MSNSPAPIRRSPRVNPSPAASTSPPPKRVEWLFAQGATGCWDSWLFSNFIGLSKAFSRGKASATYFNAFNVDHYFETLLCTPTLSFGFTDAQDDTPLEVFHKGETPYWQQVSAGDEPTLPQRILNHLSSLANTLYYFAGNLLHLRELEDPLVRPTKHPMGTLDAVQAEQCEALRSG
ncbi:hypothetical protein BDV96DRAFT_651567 [Lophiotrema nucula]|uniref:Uncharacterized protein n=1 Tax=Lophiotrema nucula TaxID=690887 RepID=A0A6A5YR21_9PLEO|nr:hypothetical protein BDV96DRAFT_651567 [Lophiotrema nucula]